MMKRSVVIQEITHAIIYGSNDQHTIDRIVELIERYNNPVEGIRFGMAEINEVIRNLSPSEEIKAAKIFNKIDDQNPGWLKNFERMPEELPNLSKLEQLVKKSSGSQSRETLIEHSHRDEGHGGR